MINGRRRPNIIYVPVFLLIGPACDKYWIKKHLYVDGACCVYLLRRLKESAKQTVRAGRNEIEPFAAIDGPQTK